MGRGKGENEGKGNKKHNWSIQNRQGEVKNSIGNGEAKELTCMTRGCELRVGGMLVGRGCRAEGEKGEKKTGQL